MAGSALVLVTVVAIVLAGSSEPAEIRGASVSNDGRRLDVEYAAPDETCGGEPQIRAEETSSVVTVTVEIHRRFEFGTRACLLRGRIASAAVDLANPLGDRLVIDSSTGRPVPLTEDHD
ncbi:hypothetical protein GCM10010531_10940 [Blastococcus jejuensis]|uniref:Uncharacterized protein n=1 Tax=Blastococcus jejuensis TaxID=351224 RepID=A0ABP6P2T3_9ACTN